MINTLNIYANKWKNSTIFDQPHFKVEEEYNLLMRQDCAPSFILIFLSYTKVEF